MQPKLYDQMRINMANREALRSSIRDQDEIARFAHELLLDDLPQLYNDELIEFAILTSDDDRRTRM